MDGRSAALWTRAVSFSSDPLGRECADPGAPEKRIGNMVRGVFEQRILLKYCQTRI